MDFLKGWNLVASHFTKQGRKSETSLQNNISSSKEDDIEVSTTTNNAKRKDSEDIVWTDNDTGDMMDLMETALNNMKKKVLLKLRRNSSVDTEDVVEKEEKEVEQLENFVSFAQVNTLNVVEEINSVMQIIAEVTTNCEDTTSCTEEIPEITPTETTVGKILETSNDRTAQENWKRLMSKLSDKRKKSIKRRKHKRPAIEFEREDKNNFEGLDSNAFQTPEVHEEDLIPDDWKPDFIPVTRTRVNSDAYNQPDVIPRDVDTDMEKQSQSKYKQMKRTYTLPVTRRSENRRYLQKQIGILHRQSWSGDLMVVPEEEDFLFKSLSGELRKGKQVRNASLQHLY